MSVPPAGARVNGAAPADLDALQDAFYARRPDVADPAQRVHFGTSGHRGSSAEGTFNEAHVLAMTQAICNYRRAHGITGPLYLGRDTHALSEPAFRAALEVIIANGIEAVIDTSNGPTPTPAISHAVVTYNRHRTSGLADAIIITPSHNPPGDGGMKYNPPHGGPADLDETRWIEDQANALLARNLSNVARIPFRLARNAAIARYYDYATTYVSALASVIDVEAIRRAGLKIGVDPLGGASVPIWRAVADRYQLDIEVVNDTVDPTFRFVPAGGDGRIQIDCASPVAMAALVALKDRFDIAVANDPDADRHGIVTPGAGLMNPHHYLAVAVDYLFTHRPAWRPEAAVGTSVVSSSVIDRAAARVGRAVVEVPVGFKWFAPGLLDGSLGIGTDECGGASFLRRDGTVWTTDKDGILLALLAAEMIAVTGRDPAALADELLGDTTVAYERIDFAATDDEKARLSTLVAGDATIADLAGDRVDLRQTSATGNGAPIGGLKVSTAYGWFAVRPSGTEPVYRFYAESARGRDHLRRIQEEGLALVSRLLVARR